MTKNEEYFMTDENSIDTKIFDDVLHPPLIISGTVIKGMGRGRIIGFPTANLVPNAEQAFMERGVFYTRITIDGKIHDAITNIGVNPTFGYSQLIVESHIFNFSDDILGKEIKIELVRFIRNEIKFASVNELISQINNDIEQVHTDNKAGSCPEASKLSIGTKA